MFISLAIYYIIVVLSDFLLYDYSRVKDLLAAITVAGNCNQQFYLYA